METYGLGPNGGLVYCMEFLEANLDWLTEKLDILAGKGIRYYLFDFPGQVISITVWLGWIMDMSSSNSIIDLVPLGIGGGV